MDKAPRISLRKGVHKKGGDHSSPDRGDRVVRRSKVDSECGKSGERGGRRIISLKNNYMKRKEEGREMLPPLKGPRSSKRRGKERTVRVYKLSRKDDAKVSDGRMATWRPCAHPGRSHAKTTCEKKEYQLC